MATTIVADGGFCSGGDEDEGFYSHTDASDDSADVKVRGSTSLLRSKRKSSEPRRLETDLPAKKRKIESNDTKTNPFRPWSGSPPATLPRELPSKIIPWLSIPRPHLEEKPQFPLTMPVPHPFLLNTPTIVPRPSRHLVQQDEPLSLVSKKKTDTGKNGLQRLPQSNRVATSDKTLCDPGPSDTVFKIDSLLSRTERTIKLEESQKNKTSQQCQQRNYKNMTRERRIEANARERTRVHTISAAFDTLRQSIPAYSHNQKLSKLSVLRIACSYIVTLSRLSGEDYSEDQSEPDLSECVSNVSRTIQTEGKIRKKKDD